jgi:hypothetical protein
VQRIVTDNLSAPVAGLALLEQQLDYAPVHVTLVVVGVHHRLVLRRPDASVEAGDDVAHHAVGHLPLFLAHHFPKLLVFGRKRKVEDCI